MMILNASRPRDAQGDMIDVFTYFGGKSLALTTSSARVAVPTGAGLICLYVTGNDCYVKFGDSSVTTDSSDGDYDVVLAAGAYFLHPVIQSGMYVAAATLSSTGTLYVFGMK